MAITRHRAQPLAIAVAAAIVLTAPAGAAQPERAAGRLGTATLTDLQRIVDQAAAKSGAVGVQVSVILGEHRADFVSGSANAELGTPMTVDAIVQIGSATKVLNAALIMSLVDEGVLSLDRPVKTYLPDLDLADDGAEQVITLRQLLSMTSGLDNGPYTDHGGGDDWLGRYVKSLGTMPQAFRPGTGWGYSNAGTSIAGYAAERVAGKSWDTLLRQRILERIGLTHAVTRPQDLPFQRVSVGHTSILDGKRPTVVRPWYLTQAQGPAGSTLAMSAQDLATFGQIFLHQGKAANGNQVLSPASTAVMMTPVTKTATRGFAEHWCIGLEREHWSGTPVFGHAGGNASGTSYLKIFPEREGVLAITVNTPSALAVFAEEIFDGFGPAVFRATRSKLAAPATAITVKNPDRYVGTYSMLGISYQVTREGSALSLVVAGTGSAPARYTLVPLDLDRFLVSSATAGSAAPPFDVGFFGDDGQGRAANLVAPVFPAKRVP